MANDSTLRRIQKRVKQLAAVVHAPDADLPTFGSTEDGARPHIEVVGELPYYVVVERGQELVRDAFVDEDALLERIFTAVTFSMACSFEVRNRIDGEDCRRAIFARQLELLALLDPNWSTRRRAQMLELLLLHPFSDGKEPRDQLDPP
ncbi:MAG TPA: Imm63 family immunity protein [Polyangiaceae bacterium]|nr:Imm63 family immunity protein [Polyangiaceae bacterium]